MSLVNFQKLQNRFDMLWSIIAEKQAGTCQEISFRKGWIHSQEGYKYKILAQSQEILRSAIAASSTDSEYSSIGAKLLAIQPHLDGKIQNLVDYRDIEFFYSQVCKKPCEIGRLLHTLFTEDKDAEIFKALANILKNKYALISYFFFLKDSSKDRVVRPNNFMERFAYIDAPAKSAAVCSWENYTTYNAVLSEVRSFLLSCLDEDVTLTDAHSFLWMFWLFNEHTVATPIIPVEEQLCTGVYTSAKEGRKILYYTTKYERDTNLVTRPFVAMGIPARFAVSNSKRHTGIGVRITLRSIISNHFLPSMKKQKLTLKPI